MSQPGSPVTTVNNSSWAQPDAPAHSSLQHGDVWQHAAITRQAEAMLAILRNLTDRSAALQQRAGKLTAAFQQHQGGQLLASMVWQQQLRMALRACCTADMPSPSDVEEANNGGSSAAQGYSRWHGNWLVQVAKASSVLHTKQAAGPAGLVTAAAEVQRVAARLSALLAAAALCKTATTHEWAATLTAAPQADSGTWALVLSAMDLSPAQRGQLASAHDRFVAAAMKVVSKLAAAAGKQQAAAADARAASSSHGPSPTCQELAQSSLLRLQLLRCAHAVAFLSVLRPQQVAVMCSATQPLQVLPDLLALGSLLSEQGRWQGKCKHSRTNAKHLL